MDFLQSVTVLSGVGEARRKLLEEAGFSTLGDLLLHFPRGYVDTRTPYLRDCVSGQPAAAYVTVTGSAVTLKPHPGLMITKLPIADDTGRAFAVWYNAPWAANAFPSGWQGMLVGQALRVDGELRLVQPAKEEGELPPLLPVYAAPKGLGQKWMRRLVWEALTMLRGSMPDPLPSELLRQYGLPEKNKALEWMHLPESREQAEAAGQRLALEELLLFVTALDALRESGDRHAPVIPVDRPLLEKLKANLGYTLTAAQQRVLEEILRDMARRIPMNRMVQGDVGCGKTVLALLAIANVLSAGRQAALMAPTEILARQLYANAVALLEPYGYRVRLLLGSTREGEKREIRSELASGEADLAVGTHALLSSGVTFRDLALTVTDEQHRFGVRQRAAIQEKGIQPHSLIMSATPVPRSLALVLYGDLSLSIVDGMPPGRKPIKTHIVPPARQVAMWRYVAEEAAAGRQTYIVCPVISDSDALPVQSAESLYKELSGGALASVAVGLVHGRMAADKRDAVLDAFRRGELGVLVSTTVVEVGVHVPGACIMVIMNPERFGLAQLHQLRGRVGRGSMQAYCFLAAGEMGDNARSRLEVLTESQDGFYVAEQDLLQRGPGEFLGVRQSGMLDARVTALMENPDLVDRLETIRQRTEEIPGCRAVLLEAARQRYGGWMENPALN